MKRLFQFVAAVCLASLAAVSCHKGNYEFKVPGEIVKSTFTYAVKDSDTLRLDVYRDSTWTTPHQTVMFSFGGGWADGDRSECMWASRFVREGYTFVSIDYRKTLEGYDSMKDSTNFGAIYDKAMRLAIEDLFDATSYMVANANDLCVDPAKIVTMGASAGAINSVTGEWMICNGDSLALAHLPKDFNYAGVISMAGSVWKYGSEVPTYAATPCPHMFMHGTKDQAVAYGTMAYPQCDYYGFGPEVLTELYKQNNWPFYSFIVEDADHYFCCGPDFKMMLPNENVDYTRVVFDFLERSVHEYLPMRVEYYEKDLDGARTFPRLMKKMAKAKMSPSLKKQVGAMPEVGSGVIETKVVDFAIKDGDTLRMDIIRDPGFTGKRPVLLYSFGGGWESGHRTFIEHSVYPLAESMAAKGFVVVDYDYRLIYRKAKKEGLIPDLPIVTYVMQNGEFSDTVAFETIKKAMRVAVEDLYDATTYLVENADSLSIDPAKIVTMGGSAGGFNCLQAEYLLCNNDPLALEHLPKGFDYAGAIPCAGAIGHYEDDPIHWDRKPCPILFYHGSKDSAVAYDHGNIGTFNWTISGPASLIESLNEVGASYIFYTCIGRDHDVAALPNGYMDQFTTSFIDRLVFNGEQVQATVYEEFDPSVTNPMMLYLQRLGKYSFRRIMYDYYTYIEHEWD